MVEIDPVKVGVMWQKVEAMEKEVSELRDDVKQLLELANKSKGGLWAGMAVISAVSSFIGFLIWALYAPLGEGVPCQGIVSIDTKRKVIQWFQVRYSKSARKNCHDARP